MIDSRNWCLQCGALDTEPAREQCIRPMWHLPHFTGQVPAPKPKARLPYPDDGDDE